jgi:NTE family protein
VAAEGGASSSPRIGLALGGGGARGFAHIAVLEALDDLGLRPAIIAGASIGAVMGAGYAAGMTGADMAAYATGIFRNRSEVLARFWQLRPRRMRDLFAESALTIGQFDAVRVLEKFLPDAMPRDFSELSIPLKVVATDFYGWHEVVFDRGPLVPAIAASAALPVLFRPVEIGGSLMIDGGVSNPVPFDHAAEGNDIVIAVDVTGGPTRNHRRRPSATETLFGSMQLFMRSLVNEKLKRTRPDILLRPPQNSFRVLDFMKASLVLKSAEPMKEEIKRCLDALLEGRMPPEG